MSRRLRLGLLCGAASACLVQRPPPELPARPAVHETRRTVFPDGSTRREFRVLAWPDGRTERDGLEREFHADGTPAAERSFAHDQPAGLWRTWFAGGGLRSELDFGVPGAGAVLPARSWHENGQLAAEGTTRAGVREGPWRFFGVDGVLLGAGGYRDGLRDGAWTLCSETGAPQARGVYALGARVGTWTLWDEQGSPHERESGADPRDRDGP